jgi:hypothetical protein
LPGPGFVGERKGQEIVAGKNDFGSFLSIDIDSISRRTPGSLEGKGVVSCRASKWGVFFLWDWFLFYLDPLAVKQA